MKRLMMSVALAALACSGVMSSSHLASAHEAPQESTTAQDVFIDLPDFLDRPDYAKYAAQHVIWGELACQQFTARQRVSRTVAADDEEDPFAAECATVTVPKNWYNPVAGDLTVALYRLKSAGGSLDDRSKRLLLTNPGGPGGSGEFFGKLAAHELGATDTHVSIGIDPRGVGASTALVCPSKQTTPGAYRADGDFRYPTMDSVRLAQADRDRYNTTCQHAAGGLAEFINTDQTARDFNLIRHVLGYDTADYFGVSYGTWLGAHIERSFPNKFDRVLLDGNTDWSVPDLEPTLDAQAGATQAVVDQYILPFWARHDDVFQLGNHPLAVSRNIDRIIQASSEGKLGRLRPVDITSQLSHLMNSPGTVSFTGNYLRLRLADLHKEQNSSATAATGGGPSHAADIADATAPGVAANASINDAAYWAIRCGDTPNSQERESHWRARFGWATQFPVMAASSMVNACASWHGKPAMDPQSFARPVSQVLMVDREADGRTGYAGARHARMTAPGNVRMVVTDDAVGHGLSHQASPCARQVVGTYMTQGVFPSRDIACQARAFGGSFTSGPGQPMTRVFDEAPHEFMNPMGPQRTLPRSYVYAMRRFDPALPDQDGADPLHLEPEWTTLGEATRDTTVVSPALAAHLATVNTPPAE